MTRRHIDRVPMAPGWASPFMLLGYLLIVGFQWVITKTGHMDKWRNRV